MATVSVLIPTFNRKTALAVTLSCLVNQTYRDFDVYISDQSDTSYLSDPDLQAIYRVLVARGNHVYTFWHLPRRGIAENRQFLLERSESPYVLFMDDDIISETQVLERMVETIQTEGCGFVGAFPAGLSFLQDERPHEQRIEFWEGPVVPEMVRPGTPQWDRHLLHKAANIYHVALRLPPGTVRRYKVAWCGAVVLYDRRKLLSVGGFSFWHRLPPQHAGEEVLVQLLMLQRYGGCGIIPSGTYHMELPTTIQDRRVLAYELLPEMEKGLDRLRSEWAGR